MVDHTQPKHETHEDLSEFRYVDDSRASKEQHYKWKDPGAPGVFRWLHKTDLKLDLSYQREKVSKDKVLEIAANWSWPEFGAISIGWRPQTGEYFIVDGGHRWRASQYRASIVKLPCMVFESEGPKEEAELFIDAGKKRSNITAYQLFHAAVTAEDPNALATQQLLANYEMEATQDLPSKYKLNAISTLRKQVSRDPDRAEKVLSIALQMCEENEFITASLLRGLFAASLKVKSVDILTDRQCFRKLDGAGLAGVEMAMKREKALQGRGGETVEAKAIIDILNKNRKRKLSVDL